MQEGDSVGQPTGATIVLPDGTEEAIDDADVALQRSSEGIVEYKYEYSPKLIPSMSGDLNLWRYRNLLPLSDGNIRYPLQIGGTPLHPVPGLREMLGMSDLWIKDETRTPTGSNKDRATALVLEHAIRDNHPIVSCASTGNVAASLAIGAASCGRRAVIFVPSATSDAKLRLMRLAGATVLQVRQGYDAAFKLSQQAAAEFGWYNRNTGFNPLTTEAKKTVALEIWEQFGRQMPDVMVSPVGDGPTLSALAKGFRELVLCGAAEKMPRIIGVQAEGCQPLVRAWQRGMPIEPSRPDTLADGIAVEMPVSGYSVLRDVRESGGDFVAVSDDQMLEGINQMAENAGLLAEPAGVAGFAGLKVARENGIVGPDERTAVLMTGTLFKNMGYGRAFTQPHEIDADLDQVRAIVES
jgi:threonine synthase